MLIRVVAQFMKHTLTLLTGLLFAPLATADITLIRDGQPQVVIIVPDGLYKHVQKPAEQLTSDGVSVPLAAVELADYLGKIGGTRPQIATETQKGIPEGPRIFVGPCQASADLAPKPEEIVVVTRDGHLHLCGGDSGPGGMACRGTLFAVYDLLERDLGVRWLGLGDWIFECRQTTGQQLWEKLKPIHENRAAGRAKVDTAMQQAAGIQKRMVDVLAEAVAKGRSK